MDPRDVKERWWFRYENCCFYTNLTYRLGGLDVIEASLARQTVLPDHVFVSDELFEKRWRVWEEILERVGIASYATVHEKIKKGFKRNLAASYNRAAEEAVKEDCDLFISLQDYIWIPPDGIERFVDISLKCPGDLITGLTSISADPTPGASFIVNYPAKEQNFYYSIFDKPYTNKPKTIQWLDCRIDGVYDYKPEDWCLQILTEHWESNWSAVPVDYFRAGIFWDEEFDKGIAYENMDFAKRAINFSDRRVIMDTRNHAISLPHKDYFPGEREEIVEFSNKERYEERWGPT